MDALSRVISRLRVFEGARKAGEYAERKSASLFIL
jgi:hypothetical protein